MLKFVSTVSNFFVYRLFDLFTTDLGSCSSGVSIPKYVCVMLCLFGVFFLPYSTINLS